MIRRGLPVLLAAILASAGLGAAPGAAPAQAGFDEGMAYYQKGDYFRALSELKPEAEAGNALAQVQVAGIYHYGLIGHVDFAKALRWYRLAADQDNPDGMLGLGVMYSFGQGVKKDPVEAYKWLRLAADRLPQSPDRNRIVGALDALAEGMNTDEVARAKALAKDWKPGDACRGDDAPQCAGPPSGPGSGGAPGAAKARGRA
jgi:TPR repeat protein